MLKAEQGATINDNINQAIQKKKITTSQQIHFPPHPPQTTFLFSNWLQLNLLLLHQLLLNSFCSTTTPTQSTPPSSPTTPTQSTPSSSTTTQAAFIAFQAVAPTLQAAPIAPQAAHPSLIMAPKLISAPSSPVIAPELQQVPKKTLCKHERGDTFSSTAGAGGHHCQI